MKNVQVFMVVLSIVFTSCESDHKNSTEIPTGTYSGTFQRQLAFGGGEIANVTISFSDKSWVGQSDKPKYPALCYGTFILDNNKIVFINECAWTAEFDWSLILSGTYDFTLTGKQLLIKKEYSGSSTDTYSDNYILTKQE